jgi:hypothetical protein
MTFDEFMRTMLTAWPDAIVDESPSGELIVYTGVMSVGDKIVKVPTSEPF